MNTFSSLTLWIILATVMPGLVTISCLLVIFRWVYPEVGDSFYAMTMNSWYEFSFVVAIMIVTQVVGIVQEQIFNGLKLFPRQVELSAGAVKLAKKLKIKAKRINPSEEYGLLYMVLSMLQPDDDKHGHIQRVAGQFFLTVNCMASYLIGALVALAMAIRHGMTSEAVMFLIAMLILYVFTFKAMQVRFTSLVSSLWIARHIALRRISKI